MSTPELYPAAPAMAVMRAPRKARRAAQPRDPVLHYRPYRDRAIARHNELADVPPGGELEGEQLRRLDVICRIERRLLATPAATIEGVIYKLAVLFDAVLELGPRPEGEPPEDTDPETWGLWTILDDLERLAARDRATSGNHTPRAS